MKKLFILLAPVFVIIAIIISINGRSFSSIEFLSGLSKIEFELPDYTGITSSFNRLQSFVNQWKDTFADPNFKDILTVYIKSYTILIDLVKINFYGSMFIVNLIGEGISNAGQVIKFLFHYLLF